MHGLPKNQSSAYDTDLAKFVSRHTDSCTPVFCMSPKREFAISVFLFLFFSTKILNEKNVFVNFENEIDKGIYEWEYKIDAWSLLQDNDWFGAGPSCRRVLTKLKVIKFGILA